MCDGEKDADIRNPSRQHFYWNEQLSKVQNSMPGVLVSKASKKLAWSYATGARWQQSAVSVSMRGRFMILGEAV